MGTTHIHAGKVKQHVHAAAFQEVCARLKEARRNMLRRLSATQHNKVEKRYITAAGALGTMIQQSREKIYCRGWCMWDLGSQAKSVGHQLHSTMSWFKVQITKSRDKTHRGLA